MDKISLPTLLKVAGGVSVLGIGVSIWMEQKMQSTYRQQRFYQKSVQLLQNYGPAAQCLGKPIYSGRVKIGDENKLKVDNVSAKLVIPVVGSVDKGTLYVLASREDKAAEWDIDQLDIEIKTSNQKWTFYQRDMTSDPRPLSTVEAEQVSSPQKDGTRS